MMATCTREISCFMPPCPPTQLWTGESVDDLERHTTRRTEASVVATRAAQRPAMEFLQSAPHPINTLRIIRPLIGRRAEPPPRLGAGTAKLNCGPSTSILLLEGGRTTRAGFVVANGR